jgi:hypothetical protein
LKDQAVVCALHRVWSVSNALHDIYRGTIQTGVCGQSHPFHIMDHAQIEDLKKLADLNSAHACSRVLVSTHQVILRVEGISSTG